MEKKTFTVQCEKCSRVIELDAPPNPKFVVFLCNGCALKWHEIRDKMISHAYADEVGKAFTNFVNSKLYTSKQV